LDFGNAYPYTAKDGPCKFRPEFVGAYVPGGPFNITEYDEEELLYAVAYSGPVSVAF